MKTITIEKNDSGQRLDRFMAKAVPLLPGPLCQKYIRLKRIKVNGKAGKRDTRLAEGDVLSLYINDEFFEKPCEDNIYLTIAAPKVNIVYEDENIILVDKPAGISVHADNESGSITLIDNIKAYMYQSGQWRPKAENCFAPALCNRIDRNTQGIVIAAKNAQALRIMSEKIRNREITKKYLCIVHGRLLPKDGRLENYIFKDSAKNRVYVSQKSSPGAKTAITDYKTIAYKDGLSLVECTLLTGRTHQIRAQMAFAGHPLLGDGKYGKPDTARGINYQCLCSYFISFDFTGESCELDYLKGRFFTVKNCTLFHDFFQKELDFLFEK